MDFEVWTPYLSHTYYTYKQRPVASVKFGAMWDSWGGFFDESDPGIKPVL